MVKKLILPPPRPEYKPDHEALRNRELETWSKILSEKIDELESRIRALEP